MPRLHALFRSLSLRARIRTIHTTTATTSTTTTLAAGSNSCSSLSLSSDQCVILRDRGGNTSCFCRTRFFSSSATVSAVAVANTVYEYDSVCEMTSANLRFGVGATAEVGADLATQFSAAFRFHPNAEKKKKKMYNVVIFTDSHLRSLPCLQAVLESLDNPNHHHHNAYGIHNKIAQNMNHMNHGMNIHIYDQVRTEPNDVSFRHAIEYLRNGMECDHHFDYDAVIAVGGGSVMDTAKAANLYASFNVVQQEQEQEEVDFYDFVNAPIGKGLPIPSFRSSTHASAAGPYGTGIPFLKPLIAIPTTAGTGSETTGVAIFDDTATRSKTGIASRQLKPALAIVDPNHLATLPAQVACYAGLDVLCHAMESYTALPYNKRAKPASPMLRPTYQGSNPIADVWSLYALETCANHLVDAVNYCRQRDDDNNNNINDLININGKGNINHAMTQMMLASSAAGLGFGNAGVHLCHGMSYPISSQVKGTYYGYEHMTTGTATDDDRRHPIIPHGLSVIVSAPAVFAFTATADPVRHATCARILAQARCRRQRQQQTSPQSYVAIESDSYQDVGTWLAAEIRLLCASLNVSLGLRQFGYTDDDIPALVQGTLPQHRVLNIAPRQPIGRGELEFLFQQAMEDS